jgi:RNase P subunit RPR2
MVRAAACRNITPGKARLATILNHLQLPQDQRRCCRIPTPPNYLMMLPAVDITAPRLRYLKDAAHLLAIASPIASANLGAAHNKILETEGADLELPRKEWDALRRSFCGACGSPMLPGWSSKVSHKVQPRKIITGSQKGKSTTLSKAQKDVVYTCLRCNRTTVQPIQTKPSKYLKRAIRGLEAKAAAAQSPDQKEDKKVAKSASVSSKQRAKARKGGLSVMLAHSKSSIGNTGLDLLDFMQ